MADLPELITREQIYQALFALLTPLLAPGAEDGSPDGEQGQNGAARPGTPTADRPFNLVSREVIEVQRVPPALQPVLFIYEMDEEFGDSGPGLTPLSFTVVLIFGVTAPKGTPGQTLLNPLIDRVIDALQPDMARTNSSSWTATAIRWSAGQSIDALLALANADIAKVQSLIPEKN